MTTEQNSLILPPRVARERMARDLARYEGMTLVDPDGRRFRVLDEDDLLKSLPEAASRGQAYRLNPNLHMMGSYKGIAEPRQATAQTNAILRSIPSKNPVIAAILRKRQNQIAAFARRPRFSGDTGFRVRLKETKRKPTAAAEELMKRIEETILHGGVRLPHTRTGEPGAWDHEGSRKAPSFQTMLRAVIWDSLTLDAAAVRFEVGMNRVKYPIVFSEPIDAALVRRALPKSWGKDAVERAGYYGNPYTPEIRGDIDEAAWVQMDPQGNSVFREFRWNELAYLVRNPRTDWWVQGYGYPEMEMLVDIIVGILYGVKWNTEYFDNNHMPAGILTLNGNYGEDVITEFRKQLKAMVSGPGAFHAMPILSHPDGQAAQWLPIRNDEGAGMFWREWILFCATIACAVFQMDSSEINLANFGAPSNALANSSPEARLTQSQETGLEPTLAQLEEWLTENWVEKWDMDFCLEWTGVSQRDKQEQLSDEAHRLQFGLATPNMVLAERDEPAIRLPLDKELYKSIEDTVDAHFPKDGDTDARLGLVQDAYEAAGGQWHSWPDLPVGNPAALQLAQQEMGLGQDPGMGGMGMDPSMGGMDPSMGGDPNAPGMGGPAAPNDPNAQAAAAAMGLPPGAAEKQAGNTLAPGGSPADTGNGGAHGTDPNIAPQYHNHAFREPLRKAAPRPGDRPHPAGDASGDLFEVVVQRRRRPGDR